jgi:hypothetical protein
MVHVEVQVQLRAQEPTIETTTWYAPSAPVLASEDGIVLNFVKPDRVADFEAVTAKIGAALSGDAGLRRYVSLSGWRVVRSAQRAPDGSIIYMFITAETHQGDNYDLLLALSRAFPAEAAALYGRYAHACTAMQKVVKVTPLAALGWPQDGPPEAAVSAFAIAP